MSEYLVHYGVKGMKWGKRKTKASDMVDVYNPIDGTSQQVPEWMITVKPLGGLNEMHRGLRRGKEMASTLRKQQNFSRDFRANVLWEKGSKVRRDAYMKRAKEYAGKAISRLKIGDVKTAAQHGKSAVDNLLRSIGTNFTRSFTTKSSDGSKYSSYRSDRSGARSKTKYRRP